jgi:importin subunit beta-1
MADAKCLSLLAAAPEVSIAQPILSYVEANIQSPDWHLREASVMAFVTILEGPALDFGPSM